jgi:AbrB family looped-hinge helix DNA binding protein
MVKYASQQADITIVSDKGQIVIPAHVRNKLDLKPRSKLLVYSIDDTIILKKLQVPDMKKEMQALWKKVDRRIARYGEMSEQEIQNEIERYRRERRK